MKNNFNELFKEWEKNNVIIDKDSFKKNNSKINFTKSNKKESSEELIIDLHYLTRTEALNKLKKFIINNLCSCQKKIKIIHGYGRHSKDKRVLKEAVLKFLDENKNLVRYHRPGRIGEGSSGVTIAFLKSK